MAVLECRGITRRFGSLVAVSDASLTARPGTIHAVVGENGAGKSTLLKVAAGLLAPDAGHVQVDGRELAPHTPREALRRGVAMVQQHFALVEVFTALDNIILGAEPRASLGRIDRGRARARVEAIAAELGAAIPLDAPVASLGVGDRQRLEIARALFRDAAVLILDEPTSVLAPREADALYAALRRLADRGRSVVVVTHKLDEVRAHADVVTAMRRGAVVRTEARTAAGFDVDALADGIMGDDKTARPARARAEPGDAVLSLRGVTRAPGLLGVDLEVRAREIVGIAGVEGNGQRELVLLLAGEIEADAGDVTVRGRGASVVHEDRHDRGLVLDASVRDNLVLGELEAFTRLGVLDDGRIHAVAADRLARAGVPRADLDRPARALSGGNQQKIVTARAVAREASLLVLAHPTRGVDVGASRAIHAQVLEAASAGAAVLVVSSDLPELRAIADSILVMRRGRVVASFPPEAPEAAIGAAMLGGNAAV